MGGGQSAKVEPKAQVCGFVFLDGSSNVSRMLSYGQFLSFDVIVTSCFVLIVFFLDGDDCCISKVSGVELTPRFLGVGCQGPDFELGSRLPG